MAAEVCRFIVFAVRAGLSANGRGWSALTISWRRRDDFTGIWLLPTGALGCEADREQIEATIEQDPFVARGLADFRIVEFRASQRAPDLLKRIA